MRPIALSAAAILLFMSMLLAPVASAQSRFRNPPEGLTSVLLASAPPHRDSVGRGDTIMTLLGARQTSGQTLADYEPSKSATLAVLLSAAAPGLGQIYNESYWKAPVIWALGGYWMYEWISLNGKYKDFRTQYSQSVEAYPPYGIPQLQSVRDFYRDERDKFAWYLGALYFVNLLDAYVGANLYDFSVSSDLSANGMTVPRLTASLRLRF